MDLSQMVLGWKRPIYLLCTKEGVGKIGDTLPEEAQKNLRAFLEDGKGRFRLSRNLWVRKGSKEDLARKKGVWRVESSGKRRELTPWVFARIGETIIPPQI